MRYLVLDRVIDWYWKLTFDINYNLGSDDVCVSDLVVQADLSSTKRKEGTNEYMLYLGKFLRTSNRWHIDLTFDSNLGEEILNMAIRVLNRGEPAYDANVYITHPSSLSYVGRKIVVIFFIFIIFYQF